MTPQLLPEQLRARQAAPVLFETGFAIDDVRMGVNYGLNRVRFPTPVHAGSRVRRHAGLLQNHRVRSHVREETPAA